MKKSIYTIIVSALAALPAIAQETTTQVATFENVAGVELNSDSVYYGSEANSTSNYTYVMYDDTVTTYNCQFRQGPFAFSGTLTPKWGSWTGFAISASKDTSFQSYMLGQFRNVVGGGYNSYNFGVVYGSSDSISIDKGAQVQGLYLTNSAYAHHSFAVGDQFTKPFSADSCFFKVTITGVKADGTTVSKDITLADYANGAVRYISDWQWVDLTSFGEVRALKFSFDGSDKGAWGLNTPAYVCIDNLTATVTSGINTIGNATNVAEVARYTLGGTRIQAPQHGVNIVKMSDGTVRKVLMK